MAYESSTALETHLTFCRICESLCGLEVTVRHPDLEPDWFEDGVEGFRGGGS